MSDKARKHIRERSIQQMAKRTQFSAARLNSISTRFYRVLRFFPLHTTQFQSILTRWLQRSAFSVFIVMIPKAGRKLLNPVSYLLYTKFPASSETVRFDSEEYSVDSPQLRPASRPTETRNATERAGCFHPTPWSELSQPTREYR